MVDSGSFLEACGENDLKLRLHVLPRSARNMICGVHGNALKVALQAPPVDGKANKELLLFLAKKLHLKKKTLVLATGKSSRTKTVIISSPDRDELVQRLSALIGSV